MNVDIEIIKGIPEKQINLFEDRVIYNVAVETREMAKGQSAFPYKTGKLMMSEVSIPIAGSNKEYGLSAGVDYAKYVWKMTDVAWTNPQTRNQWYETVYLNNKSSIKQIATNIALKEI